MVCPTLTVINNPTVIEVPNNRGFVTYDNNTSLFNVINTDCIEFVTNLKYLGVQFRVNVANANAYFDVVISYTKDGIAQTNITETNHWIGIGNNIDVIVIKSPYESWTTGIYSITSITISNVRPQ